MKRYENADVIEAVSTKLSLHDAQLISLKLMEEPKYVVSVTLICVTESGETVTISFSDVKRFDFYWDEGIAFYIITHLKFLEVKGGFYFSMDPFDESIKSIDERDAGVIEAKQVVLTNHPPNISP